MTIGLLLRPGIIPAYAGNICRFDVIAATLWDHPRVCGEHQLLTVASHLFLGSSPRMRGTCADEYAVGWYRGIIPAYAGNIMWSAGGATSAQDHPRVCGEHIANVQNGPDMQGSSPRMRGTFKKAVGGYTYVGIIPAYAGNIPPSSGGFKSCWDHPRVCGEHTKNPQIIITHPIQKPTF